jgi:hypothetical protein
MQSNKNTIGDCQFVPASSVGDTNAMRQELPPSLAKQTTTALGIEKLLTTAFTTVIAKST